ncbi:MAG TPA: hypothetical protein VMY88_05385 [Acidimicrobiales bacterium]|nr:hypothetical protein [Acidimicrobiales bacterium]
MGTLWTPGGEHQVGGDKENRTSNDPAQSPLSAVADNDWDDEGPELTDEQIEQMRQLEEKLAQTPASVVVANHAYGLFELAALHLGRRPPNFEQAQLAIDAMGALVEGLGDRLGDHARQLHDGLTQLRLAFVQVRSAADEPN